jgi:N-acetylglucosaminyl-diphospho-decaprenol L-rhamnosyltransferase
MVAVLPKLEIVAVNFNSGHQLRKCLESVKGTGQDNFILSRVVVVDNSSVDASSENLVDFEFQLIIKRNETNRGFAAACNQGAEGSSADYLLFLNPDTLLYEDSLDRPVAFMEHPSNREVGIVGIQLIDECGHISRTCARFPNPLRLFAQILGLDRIAPRLFLSHFMWEWDHKESREVDQVMGAFFLIRRKLFEELNGFDERFFVYFEDLDLSFRAHRAGWRSFYMSDVKTFHKGGGTSEKIKPIRLFYSLRSRILYSYKHFTRTSATALTLATLFLEPLIRSLWSLVRFALRDLLETVQAYLMLWREMPSLIRMLRRNPSV